MSEFALEPSNSASRTRSKATERYTRFAWRINQALKRGDLSFNTHGVLAYLVVALDRTGGEITTELIALKADLSWKQSSESLRLALHALEIDGWLEIVVLPGGRKWTIRLAEAHVRIELDDVLEKGSSKLPPENLQENLDRVVEVTSKETANSSSQTAHPDWRRPGAEPPHGAISLEVDVQREIDVLCEERIEDREPAFAQGPRVATQGSSGYSSPLSEADQQLLAAIADQVFVGRS